MGAKGDFTLAPLHAHINLLGFVLMTLFGLLYRVMPELAGNVLAKAHFWLHQIGAFLLLIMLFLFLSGRITEAGMVPVAPVAEITVFLGILCYVVNLFRTLR